MSFSIGCNKKITINTLRKLKNNDEKISMLTAYDFTLAKIIDQSGIEMVLVGDSASNVFAGNESTLPMTLDEMIYHAKVVAKAVKRAFVVVDIPFGYYQLSPEKALESAIRIMKETKANAVKMEGGQEISETISKVLNAGIPVMGHLGLTPQSFNQLGGYAVQGKGEKTASKIKKDALLLENLGCFSMVLEKTPAALATQISKQLKIPTIGIGAGSGTDGQVLVINDMLGLTEGFNPKFLRRYLDLDQQIAGAVKSYIKDVKDKNYPNQTEQY